MEELQKKPTECKKTASLIYRKAGMDCDRTIVMDSFNACLQLLTYLKPDFANMSNVRIIETVLPQNNKEGFETEYEVDLNKL